MNTYIMAIDAGTGSVRSIIFNENFEQVAMSQREWTHKKNPKYEGAIDFDTKGGKVLLFETIREVIENSSIDPKEIRAISTTSMREAFVLYNENKEEIWAVSNVDARAIKEVGELKQSFEGLEDEIYALSGQTFALGAIPRLLWVEKNMPEVYEKTKYMSMLNDWIVFCLTGEISAEPSNASTSGIVNAKTRDWDKNIIEKCNIKADIFPPIYESGTKVANISKEISKKTGLSTECIVAAGGGDVQMGCVGLGATKAGSAALLGGSFWQLEYNTNKPEINNEGKIRVNCHSVENIWQQELIAFFPGLVVRWFRDVFCKYEKHLAKEKGINVYELLNEMAAKVPIGSKGTLCSFSSVQDFKNWKHPSPAFVNFDIDPDAYGVEVFYRAILENAALVTLGHKKIIEENFGIFPAEIVFASGASSSELWCQIVADVLNVTVKVPKIKEATALGAAFCAGLSLGLLPSLSDFGDKYVEIEKTYEPSPENHAEYMKIYEKFNELQTSQNTLSNEGVLSYMWKAPGL